MYNYIVLAYYIFILLTWFMLRIDNIEIINLQLLFYCNEILHNFGFSVNKVKEDGRGKVWEA